MQNQENNQVSSLEALLSSIETDKQVYQWFIVLITHAKAVKKNLSQDSITETYSKLKTALKQQRIWLIFILLLILTLFATNQYLFLPACLVFLFPLQRFSKTKKKCILTISEFMLTRDFDPAVLPSKTLYQIAEIYSREYAIPSLVDAIYAQDNISRRTILFAFVISAWIYPLANLWAVFFCIFLSYFIIQAFTNTSFFYKNLK